MITQKKQKGIALVIVLIFVTIFSALSVSMFSMTSNNVVTVDNVHQANEARSCAESGLEMIRYYTGQVTIDGLTPEDDRFASLASQLVTLVNDASDTTSAYFHDSLEPHVHVGFSQSPIMLSESDGMGFYARITPDDTDGFSITITGAADSLERTIGAGFTYGVHETSVFDYGVATKGPLSMQGNILLDGVNISVESDVYIESMDYNNALEIIGNSQIAGDVSIVNPDGTVTLQGGKAGIGGETGEDAIDNHVDIGVEATEFPYPNTSHFEQFVTGITIDSSTTETTLAADGVYDNIRIAAGTNPHFSGNVQLNGIVFIETPNVVTFTGNVDITGIIVGDGDVTDNSGTNQINITGNVGSLAVDAKVLDENGEETEEYVLSDPKFDEVRDETGTFLMAPGFAISMGGSFGTLNGAIAANGIEFFGNAGGEIGGSIVNYSNEPMTLSGNNDLFFNRSGITDVPAGFVPEIVIHYDPSAYAEIH